MMSSQEFSSPQSELNGISVKNYRLEGVHFNTYVNAGVTAHEVPLGIIEGVAHAAHRSILKRYDNHYLELAGHLGIPVEDVVTIHDIGSDGEIKIGKKEEGGYVATVCRLLTTPGCFAKGGIKEDTRRAMESDLAEQFPNIPFEVRVVDQYDLLIEAVYRNDPEQATRLIDMMRDHLAAPRVVEEAFADLLNGQYARLINDGSTPESAETNARLILHSVYLQCTFSPPWVPEESLSKFEALAGKLETEAARSLPAELMGFLITADRFSKQGRAYYAKLRGKDGGFQFERGTAEHRAEVDEWLKAQQ